MLTDFYKDPDDKQSMIRLLSAANEFEIEGLIATSLAYGDGSVHPEWIREVLEDYAKVLPNLRKHEREGYAYPSAESLMRVVKAGAPVIRRLVGRTGGFPVPYPAGAHDTRSCDPAERWIGAGRDTAASEHIIHVVDRDDPRPIWVVVWGGAMDLAQALWKVRAERTVAETSRFVSKLRVYQISWQDTGAVWIWNNFPTLFLIHSCEANRGIYLQGPANMRDEAWVDANIRHGHGPLGAGYPKASVPGIKEGDTASFLGLLSIGLSDPEHPEWGGWGGRFQRLSPERCFYVDAQDRHPTARDAARKCQWTVGRWNQATSNDFAARMDWCVRGFQEANHHPVVVVDGDASQKVLNREVPAGEAVVLDAAGTHDPDGNALAYRWWQYVEAGSYPREVALKQADTQVVDIAAPNVDESRDIHIILEVTDNGLPPLTSYRRVVVTVRPTEQIGRVADLAFVYKRLVGTFPQDHCRIADLGDPRRGTHGNYHVSSMDIASLVWGSIASSPGSPSAMLHLSDVLGSTTGGPGRRDLRRGGGFRRPDSRRRPLCHGHRGAAGQCPQGPLGHVPARSPNCGGTVFDEDGDCTRCWEPGVMVPVGRTGVAATRRRGRRWSPVE